MNPDADYAKYVVTPKQALIEDTLSADLSHEAQAKKKQNLIESVRKAYREKDVVLFLGAGVSIESGIPVWTDLIQQLLIHMISTKINDKKLSKNEVKMLSKLAYDNKEESPLTQMRYIRSSFSDEQYYRLVHDVLYAKVAGKENGLLNAIADICAKQQGGAGVKSIVTYNFDDLVEQTFAKKRQGYNTVYQEDDMAAADKTNIYHAHGFLPFDWEGRGSETNLIFSEEDYHRVYRDAFSWSNLAQLNAFRDNTCLFVGCSLQDPNLRRLLDVAARSKESPRHYAILRKNEVKVSDKKPSAQKLLSLYQRIDDNIREGYFRELGLNIIWVESYAEIPDVLLQLKK